MSRVFVLYLCSLAIRTLALGILARLVLFATRRVEYRHAVWTIFLWAILLMPVADALLPRTLVPASVPEVMLPIQTFTVFAPQKASPPVLLFPSQSSAEPLEVTQIDVWEIGAAVVVLGACALLVRLILVLRAVQRLKKRSSPIRISLPHEWAIDRQRLRLAESPSVRVPLTIGFWKPLILLPADWRAWEDWKLRAVLVHEWTHVRRRDWAVAAVASFAKCIFWFNPLVWWLERKLSSLAELASDEASVRYSGDSQRYAETLLQFAADARRGHRWIGGVAMAQHKIALRIERVLALRKPGSGVLPKTAWIFLCVAGLPALYLSAATQANPREIPALSAEVVETLQTRIPNAFAVASALTEPQQTAPPAPQVPASPPAAAPAGPPQGNPTTPATPPQETPSPVAPATTTPTPPGNPNPDLVGEIRLILFPVTQVSPQGNIQVEIQTQNGTNRFSGGAVWNIANGALSPSSWARNNANWGINNAFTFALTGVQNRTLQFEGENGSVFSFGCADCSFFVWEGGVGASPVAPAPGISFQLSADGQSISVTCRAVQCRVAMQRQVGQLAGSVVVQALNNSESFALPVGADTKASFSVAR